MGQDNDKKKKAVDKYSVLEYFLALFKHQLGLGSGAASEIRPLEQASVRMNLVTYSLSVADGNVRQSRRMTLGPIGEGTGSKSKCFLAIYDNKIVVKVPPVPITDFDKYISGIKKEQTIAKKLYPRECIVPGIAVIMEKIYNLPGSENMRPDELEAAYLEALYENPEYQEFFKIDGGFAFFMDLAKYVFLADAISLFHDLGGGVKEELLTDPSIIGDFEKFEGRYGMENAGVGAGLEHVFSEYERGVRKLLIRSGAVPSVLLYKIQRWFFTYLAGEEIKPNGADLTDTFVSQLNALLKDVVKKNREAVDEYLAMVDNFLKETSFSQHKLQMEGVIANTLELLAWLMQKGIAIRDIKPDNLLVAGDTERYPYFLSSPDAFRIGLIDVETAVDFAPESGNTIIQPPLGGTPFYATPLHLFKNSTIVAVYRDLRRALYLQDWFAVVAMIYGTIIDEYLFLKTAKQVVALTRMIQQAIKSARPMEQLIKTANQRFWPCAIEEFLEKTETNKHRLSAVRVLPQYVVYNMLADELERENRFCDKLVKTLISRQSFFKNKQNREQLYMVSPEKLADVMNKIKDKKADDPSSFAALERIHRIKLNMKKNSGIIERLHRQDPWLSAYEVLVIMFSIVRNFMYGPAPELSVKKPV